MNKQELIEKYEHLNHDCFRRVDTSKVLKDLKQLDEPQKVKIPQFVADWIEYCKFTHVDLQHALIVGDVYFYNYANQKDFSKLKEFFEVKGNQELFTRAWLDGHEVEKEPKYTVKIKAINCATKYLVFGELSGSWFFAEGKYGNVLTKYTRKELEDAGFGEVFNSPLFEVEEVE